MSDPSPSPARRYVYHAPPERSTAPRQCRQCQRDFTTTRFWQRFCTKDCHDTYHKLRQQLARQLLEEKEAADIRPATLDELAE